jgi:hypothetical protein
MVVVMQGSVFSALLTDMMEAVRWPATQQQQPPVTDDSGGGTGAALRTLTDPAAPTMAEAAQSWASPKTTARALLSFASSSALRPSGSPNAKVSASADKVATVALAAHPFRPLYLSGERR